MENLKIGEGSLKLNLLVRLMKESASYLKLLESWKSFGRDLGVNDVEIGQLTHQLGNGTTKLQDIPHELLSSWMADVGDKATLKALCDALCRCRINQISELLVEKFWLEAVSSMRIKHHDKVVSLKDVLDEDTSIDTYRCIFNEIKIKTHLQPIQLLKDHVVPKVEVNYYIPRTLSYTNQVDETIFRDAPKDHSFLVKGITKYDLIQLTECKSEYQPIEVSGNQKDEVTVRFMVLERDEHFDMICQKLSSPVHLIEKNDGSYFWIKSNKAIATIYDFLKGMKKIYSEDEFIKDVLHDSPTRSFCISDSPGMGKTFLLQNLASKMKERNDSMVMFIPLHEFVKTIKTINSNSSALGIIVEYVGASAVAELILNAIFGNGMYAIDLFLDGYDEVAQEDNRIRVDEFLEHVKKLKNVRVFVATRPHFRHNLEKVLKVMSYELLPFNEDNQVHFLTRYWKDKCSASAEHSERIENYARKCLITLRAQLADDQEREIAGIPLQGRMLADVFAGDAEDASLDLESTETIKITSIFEMYKKLVDLKFGRIPQRSKKIYNILNWFKRSIKTNYVNAHIYASIALLFPDWIDKITPYLKGFQDVDTNTLYSIGLIEKSPHLRSPEFIHRTFAEYILAEFLVNNEFSECVEMLFGVIVGGAGVQDWKPRYGYSNHALEFTLEHSTIAYFINMHYMELAKRIPVDNLLSRILKHRFKIDLKDLCKAIAACGSQDLEFLLTLCINIFQRFDIVCLSQDMQDKYFKLLPHLTVQRYHSIDVVKRGIDFVRMAFRVDLDYHVYTNECYSLPWIPQCTPLHVAVYYGKYNIVTYLIQQYGEGSKKLNHLFRLCAISSSENSNSMIKDKLSIIEVLRKKQYDLNWLQQDQDTPLLADKVHLKILDKLVAFGANINAYSKNYGSLLHSSSDSNNWKELLLWVKSRKFKLINFADCQGNTALMKALESSIVDGETLQLFHDMGADYDARNLVEDSVLFHALKTQTKEIIGKIIDYGANVNHKNLNQRNAAHVILLHTMSPIKDSQEVLDKMNLLISKGFNLLKEPDSEGYTPFHFVMGNVKYLDNPKLLDFFLSNEIDFCQKYPIPFLMDPAEPVLFHVIGRISYSSLEKIIDCGGDINYIDEYNRTAAHFAFEAARTLKVDSDEVIKTLTLLISKGFTKINHPDCHGRTPLHLALLMHDDITASRLVINMFSWKRPYASKSTSSENLKMLEFFREHGADFNAVDGNGNSVLFYAILWSNMPVIEKLIEWGADVNHVNNDNKFGKLINVANDKCSKFILTLQKIRKDAELGSFPRNRQCQSMSQNIKETHFSNF